MGEPSTWYADSGTAVAEVSAISTPTGIVASGGMLGLWPESVSPYLWDLWNRPSASGAIRQIVGSLEDGPLKSRLSAEWADVLGSPDPRSVTASLPSYSAARGGICYVTPPGLTVDPDGTVHGYIATWPKMSKIARLKHRARRRWTALRLAVGYWVSGREDEPEDEDW